MEIGIRELRDGLSRHLDVVREGGTITVTDHGKPIARIVPVGRPTKLEQLIAEGRITPAKVRKGTTVPDPIKLAGGGTVSEFIDEQRR